MTRRRAVRIVALDPDGLEHRFRPVRTRILKSHLRGPRLVVDLPACPGVLFYCVFVPLRSSCGTGLAARDLPPPPACISRSRPPSSRAQPDTTHSSRCGPRLRGAAALVAWTRPLAAGPAPVAGLLLGLAFWCHILAVILRCPPCSSSSPAVPRCRRWPARRRFALGYAPGLLWNAPTAESLRYFFRGGGGDGSVGTPLRQGWSLLSDTPCPRGLRPRLGARPIWPFGRRHRAGAVAGRRTPRARSPHSALRAVLWLASCTWCGGDRVAAHPGHPRYLNPPPRTVARCCLARSAAWVRPLLAVL